MTYTVNFTNNSKSPISIANRSVDTSTSVALLGQDYENYGDIVAENFLHLLENFANDTAPANPVEGQLWYDSANNELKYFDDTVANSGNWKSIASLSIQSTAPTSEGERNGHFWLDDSSGKLNIYYNGDWVSVSDVAGDTTVVTRTRYDTSDVTHRTVELIVNNQIVSITSSDPTSWNPQNSGPNTEYLEDGTTLLDTHFPTIVQGVNLNTSDNYVFSGTATKALYADLAERYHADAHYQYGTLVKIGGVHEITQTTKEYDPQVFGVISDKPAFAMNSAAGDNNTHPYVALSGRVQVRVIGKVSKGDRLVSSNVPGHAMSGGEGLNWQYVIGRALENKINDEPGMIEVVVGTK